MLLSEHHADEPITDIAREAVPGPRLGPAAYRATTQEDGLRREANAHVDSRFVPSPQVVESDSRTLSRWRRGFKSVGV
jgi:hypothetical protein